MTRPSPRTPPRVWPLLSALALGACTGDPKDSGRAAPDTTAAPGGPSEATSDDGRFTVRYTSRPAPIPQSEDFALDWTVAGADGLDGLAVTVDAWMPDHGHGMNTRPETAGAGAAWTTTGMLFHMPGDWELVVELRGVGDTATLTLPYLCCED